MVVPTLTTSFLSLSVVIVYCFVYDEGLERQHHTMSWCALAIVGILNVSIYWPIVVPVIHVPNFGVHTGI